MLPFDNKSEFQVIVNMPNGTTLEETARATDALARAALEQPDGQFADLCRRRLTIQFPTAW